MANLVRSFRLLDLPGKSIKSVLQCSEVFDLISFSLCSKKMLAVVKSLKLRSKHFEVSSDNKFKIQLLVGQRDLIEILFCEDGHQNVSPSRRLKVDYVEGCYPYEQNGRNMRQWRNAKFGGRDWICHFMTVFNYQSISQMAVVSSHFLIDSFVSTVKDFNIVELFIDEGVPEPYCLRILRTCPCPEKIILISFAFDELSYNSILLKNHESAWIKTDTKLTLDQVVSVNSKVFHIWNWSIRDANRFIKLWKTGSNTRLRYVVIETDVELTVANKESLLKGVKYQVVPEETIRTFELTEYFTREMEVKGGYDIVSANGRRATVVFYRINGMLALQMFIWL